MRLPAASQVVSELEAAPVIAVSDEALTLDGRTIDVPAEGAIITDLHDQLVTLKNNFKLLHPSDVFRGTVLIASEEDVGFATVKRILYSCRVAGYDAAQLIVRKRI